MNSLKLKTTLMTVLMAAFFGFAQPTIASESEPVSTEPAPTAPAPVEEEGGDDDIGELLDELCRHLNNCANG